MCGVFFPNLFYFGLVGLSGWLFFGVFLMGRVFICFVFSLVIRLSIFIQILYIELACSVWQQDMK